MHTLVPLLIPHETIEASIVFGYAIHVKTQFMMNVRAICRDPKTWGVSMSFDATLIGYLIGKYSHTYTHGQDFELLHFGSGDKNVPWHANFIVAFVVANHSSRVRHVTPNGSQRFAHVQGNMAHDTMSCAMASKCVSPILRPHMSLNPKIH